jgi:hypothetical protein
MRGLTSSAQLVKVAPAPSGAEQQQALSSVCPLPSSSFSICVTSNAGEPYTRCGPPSWAFAPFSQFTRSGKSPSGTAKSDHETCAAARLSCVRQALIGGGQESGCNVWTHRRPADVGERTFGPLLNLAPFPLTSSRLYSIVCRNFLRRTGSRDQTSYQAARINSAAHNAHSSASRWSDRR